jgi:hypothetical protein
MKTWLAIATLSMLGSCPQKPLVRSVIGLPTCAATNPTSDNVCKNMFTKEGLVCVQCPGVGGCFDDELTVYCVKTSCFECDAR